MMTTKAKWWLSLANDCETALGPNRGIEFAIYESLGQKIGEDTPKYTMSLDAITALIERELPGAWAWTLGQNIHHRNWIVSINNLDEDGAPYSVCWGSSSASPAIALCAAFCRAMAERSE